VKWKNICVNTPSRHAERKRGLRKETRKKGKTLNRYISKTGESLKIRKTKKKIHGRERETTKGFPDLHTWDNHFFKSRTKVNPDCRA